MIREGPFDVVFSENGGYDCMTHAWIVRDRHGFPICVLDLASYGQQRCDDPFRSPEAKEMARKIADLLNADDGLA